MHTQEKGVRRRQVGTAVLALVCLSPVMSCAAGDACPPSLEVFPEVGVFVYEGLSDDGEMLRKQARAWFSAVSAHGRHLEKLRKRQLPGPVLDVPVDWHQVGPSVVVLQQQGWLSGTPRAEKCCSGALPRRPADPQCWHHSASQASGRPWAHPDQNFLSQDPR